MEYRHPKKIWKDPSSAIVDFGRVFGIGVFMIGGLLQWHAAHWAWSWQDFASQAHVSFLWWLTGGIVLSLSTFTPWLIRPVYFLWIFLGQTIGWLVNHVILGTLFYLVFTPTGIFFRRGCQVIAKKPDIGKATYWEPKVIRENAESYYRQF